MINLLPDEEKRNIRAARMNVILLRYNFITLVAIFILAAFCLAFYMILSTNQQKALALRSENSNKSQSLSSVRVAAEEYRRNLGVAKTILKNGISYTDVIIAITKLLPPGTVLDSINLTAASFSGQTKFQAHAVSYDAAEQLKQSFQSSKIFSNVYFEALTFTSNPTDTVSKKYPVTISISATLKDSETFNEN